MVCYARRATGILSIAIAALFLFGADTAHLFNVAGLLLSLAIVFGGAAVGAAVLSRRCWINSYGAQVCN